jgi:hypothetical protein
VCRALVAQPRHWTPLNRRSDVSKATPTRREAPRTATPEEPADERRRADEARSAIPPEVLELRAAVDAVLADGRIEDRLLNQGWMPTTPAEVVAVFDDHAASLESAHDEIELLEARLALLEGRMTASPEWSPEPGNKAQEGLLEPLRLGDGEVDWSPDEKPTGDALHDLDTGALRPQTWPQLLRCLQVLANHVNWMLNDHIDAEVDRDGVVRAVALLISSAGIHRGPK